jgi:ribosome-associated toxin RatA of RatAB toxin-antitoxin module
VSSPALRTHRTLRHGGESTLALLTLAATSTAAQQNLDWLDRAALDAGGIQVELLRGNPSLPAEIRLAVEIDAAPEFIWEVLKDCDAAPEYVPNVQACRRIEQLDEGRAEVFVQTIKPMFFMPSFEHVFRLDYTPHSRIDAQRVSGPIELLQGSWQLVPQDNGRTLLLYELALDPGMPIPRFLVRATLKRDLPRVLEGVRERAEAAAN